MNKKCPVLHTAFIFLLKTFINTTNGVTHCPDPGIPENGERLGNNFKIGGKIYFKCSPEYNLMGSFERYCMSNGQWSGELASCDHDSYYCVDPGIPVNGMKNSSIYNKGEIIKFDCRLGYTLLGSETRECLPNRRWSGMEVKCVGPYDFDNIMQISDILITEIDEIKTRGTGTIPALGKRLNSNYKGILNLVFAFDISRSVGEVNFRKTIAFAKAIITKMSIFNINVKVGAATFTSGSSDIIFPPFAHPKTEYALTSLDEISFTSKINDLSSHSALYLIRNYMIRGTGEASKKGKSVIFILTDGKTKIGKEYEREAEILKKDEVEIYCIAVVSPVLRNSKYKIVSENDAPSRDEHVFTRQIYAHSFMLFRLSNERGRLFLYFAFDVSENIDPQSFRESIEFSKTMIQRMGISTVGAITFSSQTAKLQFPPSQFSRVADVLVALENIQFTDAGKSKISALELIRTSLIPLAGRQNSTERQKHIVLFITDDKASLGSENQQEAKSLRKNGVDIYSIGITASVSVSISQDSLYRIASENKAGSKDEHLFILRNYDALTLLAQKITNGTIDYSQCGMEILMLSRVGGKIVGGRRAPEPWPWMAGIYYRTPGIMEDVGCGGSIVHDKFILTAAHCLYTNAGDVLDENDISVKLGLTDRNIEEYLETFAVDEFFIHEKYRYGIIFDYDIALLQLERPVDFNAFIRPICIPPIALPRDSTLYKPDDYAVAIGWGHTFVKGMQQSATHSVDHLKEVLLPIQSSETCLKNVRERLLRNVPSERIFTERMICAGDGRGGNDSCNGDSGGPLMQSQLSAEGQIYWTQIAIVSWGTGCGLRNTYGFYTHVQKLHSWIANIIELK